jgi:4-diphosphocytidyl-2-C-methyl-D-erythritol kinase
MNLRQNESKRIAHAPAKLNLFLEVLGRRNDGFHDLATLMVPVRWFDSLTFEPVRPVEVRAGTIEFSVRTQFVDEQIPEDSSNLVIRALELLRQRSGCDWGAKVELIKRIPSGAGLGGGSSDAATALRMANRAWQIGWNVEQLGELAAEIGSDVPFFLEHGAAICRGRGERIERLPRIAPLDVVILKPPTSLATAEVYAALDRLHPSPVQLAAAQSTPAADPPRLASLVRTLEQGNIVGIGRWMFNRLQAAAARLSDWVGRAEAAFSRLDFNGHQLSGSGSAYFGICRHAGEARRLASVLKARRLGFVHVTRSCY